jgi:hypothetical protein
MGNAIYPMWPWFYSPFKGEKDELPIYKAHWNFIQSNTRMLMERNFGMLKARFKIILKRIDIPLCHMANLVTTCKCLHNIIRMILTWTRLWRLKEMHNFDANITFGNLKKANFLGSILQIIQILVFFKYK